MRPQLRDNDVLLLFGSEATGISAPLLRTCHLLLESTLLNIMLYFFFFFFLECLRSVPVPGSGRMPSLNVSVSVAVVLAEIARMRGKWIT